MVSAILPARNPGGICHDDDPHRNRQQKASERTSEPSHLGPCRSARPPSLLPLLSLLPLRPRPLMPTPGAEIESTPMLPAHVFFLSPWFFFAMRYCV